jgi:hexosaminidase
MRQAGVNAFDLANEYGQRHESLQPVEHIARGGKVTYNNPYNSFYKAGGDSTLTDGVCGTWNNNDQCWQGFIRDIDLVVDLGQEKELTSVELSFLQILGPEIYLPAEVSVSPMPNADATEVLETFTVLMDTTLTDVPFVVQPYKVNFDTVKKTRYLHITAKRTPRRGWLFLDEVVVR